jgi:hypothetical protein
MANWTDDYAIDALIEAFDEVAGWSTTKPPPAAVLARRDIFDLIGGAPHAVLVEAMKRVGADELADVQHSLATIALMLLPLAED